MSEPLPSAVQSIIACRGFRVREVCRLIAQISAIDHSLEQCQPALSQEQAGELKRFQGGQDGMILDALFPDEEQPQEATHG